MTDQLENKQEEIVESNDTQQQQDVEFSPFEQRCITAGWNPNGRKSAEDWVFDGISVRNEKITDMYKITNNLQEMMKQQEENIRRQTREEFENQRREAIEKGDVNRVYALERQEEQIKHHNEMQRHAQTFIQNNADWYNNHSHDCVKMRMACQEADRTIGGESPAHHFELLQKFMHEEFPEYFGKSSEKSEEAKPKRAQAVEGSTSSFRGSDKSAGGAKRFTFDDLNADQKAMAKMFADRKIMTIEKYIEEQVKAGYLK